MKKILTLLFVLMAIGFAGFAQETSGGLTGRVIDEKGEALPGASIRVVHQPSGTVYTTTSVSNGYYNLLNLRVGGPYRVEVSYAGRTTEVREGVTVALGEAQVSNFTLVTAGQLAEAVVHGARASGARANV